MHIYKPRNWLMKKCLEIYRISKTICGKHEFITTIGILKKRGIFYTLKQCLRFRHIISALGCFPSLYNPSILCYTLIIPMMRSSCHSAREPVLHPSAYWKIYRIAENHNITVERPQTMYMFCQYFLEDTSVYVVNSFIWGAYSFIKQGRSNSYMLQLRSLLCDS